MPPPTSRKSTSRSAIAPLASDPARFLPGSGPVAVALRPEEGLQVLLFAGIEHGEDLVAFLQHRVGVGDEPLAFAQDRDQEAAFGHLQVADAAPGDAGVLAEQHLDDLQLLLL